MNRPPNILWILTDQHNPHVAGFAGHPGGCTPGLDRLAGRSAVFDAAYCQSPLCVPSRTSLLTGKWASRCSAWDNESVLFPEHETIPGWLARHGYRTAAVGKMHYRGREQMHGWQQRPYGDLAESLAATHQPDPPETADGRWNRHSVGRFPFAGPTRIPESLLTDTVVTTESLAWLAETAASGADAPWLFCASYSRPHFPLTAPARYIRKRLESLPPLPARLPDSLHPHDRFLAEDFRLRDFPEAAQRRALAAYLACVDYVDDCIAALLAGAEREGLLENTFVVYTSDHGDMAGEHGLWWKRTYYEASAGVPLLVSGPGIPAGRRIREPVELADLFPTLCDWAGIEPPPGLDGESLAPLLGPDPAARRRKRLARSELLGERPQNRFRMVRDPRWKLVEFPDAPFRLFDLAEDPFELRDLSASPPAGAPLPELRAALAAGGSWEELERRRLEEAPRRRAAMPETRRASTAQYRLADGRLVDADAPLYPAPPASMG